MISKKKNTGAGGKYYHTLIEKLHRNNTVHVHSIRNVYYLCIGLGFIIFFPLAPENMTGTREIC